MNRSLRVTAASLLLASAPAIEALEIDLFDVGTTPMTAQQLAAFRQAADLWETTFIDPVSLTLNVAWDAPSTFSNPLTILGSTRTARTTHRYGRVQLAMFLDALGAPDEVGAVTSLPASAAPPIFDLPCSPFIPGSCTLGRVPVTDINGDREDRRVTMATANAKALGLGTGLDPVYGDALANNADASIRFNTNFASQFDFDPSDGIGSTSTDFVGTAAHEIGHALGFYSIADGQDNNPDLTLHPNTLDLWRFTETGGPHDPRSERRIITAGPAEYFDSVLNNREFSRGKAVTDPLCNTSSGRCQASHWRDDLGNLMDPSIAPGVRDFLADDDVHALDYVGYNPSPFRDLLPRIIPPEVFRVGFYEFDPLAPDTPPDFGGRFDDFAPPPVGGLFFDPKLPPELGVRFGFSFDEPFLRGRSGLGFAEFADGSFDPKRPVVEGGIAGEGEVDTFPARDPMALMLPSLTSLSFLTDDEFGVPFFFTDAFADGGAMFDPFLGEFGGFRVPGLIDGFGDDVSGDVDGLLTLQLLLGEPVDIASLGLDGFVFDIGIDTIDDGLTVLDPLALGLPLRVPEPESLMLVLAGALLFFSRRHRIPTTG